MMTRKEDRVSPCLRLLVALKYPLGLPLAFPFTKTSSHPLEKVSPCLFSSVAWMIFPNSPRDVFLGWPVISWEPLQGAIEIDDNVLILRLGLYG